jgi:hypothetical protein
MIELLAGFPENVVAAVASGHLTTADYEERLIPAIERALKRLPKIRMYYQLGPDFSGLDPGAAWDDFMVGMEHLTRWERIAAVTDVEWLRVAVRAFGFLMPGTVRVFAMNEAADARAWIVSP